MTCINGSIALRAPVQDTLRKISRSSRHNVLDPTLKSLDLLFVTRISETRPHMVHMELPKPRHRAWALQGAKVVALAPGIHNHLLTVLSDMGDLRHLQQRRFQAFGTDLFFVRLVSRVFLQMRAQGWPTDAFGRRVILHRLARCLPARVKGLQETLGLLHRMVLRAARAEVAPAVLHKENTLHPSWAQWVAFVVEPHLGVSLWVVMHTIGGELAVLTIHPKLARQLPIPQWIPLGIQCEAPQPRRRQCAGGAAARIGRLRSGGLPWGIGAGGGTSLLRRADFLGRCNGNWLGSTERSRRRQHLFKHILLVELVEKVGGVGLHRSLNVSFHALLHEPQAAVQGLDHVHVRHAQQSVQVPLIPFMSVSFAAEDVALVLGDAWQVLALHLLDILSQLVHAPLNPFLEFYDVVGFALLRPLQPRVALELTNFLHIIQCLS
mmetsp:Transcript_7860/g.22491  ORF Transcript_7860/g.22491 Transcript_7860/m.22491 type:complete len:436 (+) Transcript_7860:1305-2612(+)